MMINETTNMNANITLKDSTGVDVIVAYLTAMLDSSTENYNININVVNKPLVDTVNAVNAAGETVLAQYTEFEAAVKNKAKELGFVMFS